MASIVTCWIAFIIHFNGITFWRAIIQTFKRCRQISCQLTLVINEWIVIRLSIKFLIFISTTLTFKILGTGASFTRFMAFTAHNLVVYCSINEIILWTNISAILEWSQFIKLILITLPTKIVIIRNLIVNILLAIYIFTNFTTINTMHWISTVYSLTINITLNAFGVIYASFTIFRASGIAGEAVWIGFFFVIPLKGTIQHARKSAWLIRQLSFIRLY